MPVKYTKDDCVKLLIEKQEFLASRGLERHPKREDFSPEEVVAIKAFLGPWPRALEAAGIKPPPPADRIAKNREKRIQAKQKRIIDKKAAKKRSNDI